MNDNNDNHEVLLEKIGNIREDISDVKESNKDDVKEIKDSVKTMTTKIVEIDRRLIKVETLNPFIVKMVCGGGVLTGAVALILKLI